MITDFLQVGQKVTLEVIREDKSYYFSSKIEDLTTEHILLGMPMKAGNTFHTYITETILVYFSSKDSYYCLDCTVEEKRYTPLPLLVLKSLKPPYKHQKRGYFRLKISSKIRVKTTENDEWFDGYTVDISASGAMVIFIQDLPKNNSIKIQIPDILGDVELEARVIRTERDHRNKIYPYNIALQFIDLEENQRDEIVKTLLAKQRKLRRKGLI